ncbi:unnamed protein product [Bemisia tabaci]|uniref:Protoporphyrinogen oxidase n=1 Tax=Bemisia tabaci TaxID=7038 RepID=A0A9P0F737_BEMTA|nr:unnamed protein product [Bemisia tabaci]
MTAILGGGLAGLSSAFYLLKNKAHPVTVFEGSKVVGGWIQSEKRENGVIFELGPRTIRPAGPKGATTLALLEELNLGPKVKPMPVTHPAAKNRLIYVNNKLHTLPVGISGLVRAHPPLSKSVLRYLIHECRAKKVEKEDESLYDFVERRFGEEIAEYIVRPMLCGICAGDAKEISVKFLMAVPFQLEQEHGSVIKGLIKNWLKRRDKSKVVSIPQSNLFFRSKMEHWSVYSLNGGLGELPKTLHEAVSFNPNCEVNLDANCTDIEFQGSSVNLTIKDKKHTFDHLICATSSINLAPLLKKQHPVLADELSKIPFVNVIVINLAFSKKLLKQEAFGFLVPPSQKLPILGVIYDSSCLDLKNETVLTVMMGGRWFDQYFSEKQSESELLDIALNQLKHILGINEKPEAFKVSILRNCIAQYIVGHADRVERIEKYINEKRLPITLVGASYYGVGINDVVSSAMTGVEKLSKKIALEKSSERSNTFRTTF